MFLSLQYVNPLMVEAKLENLSWRKAGYALYQMLLLLLGVEARAHQIWVFHPRKKCKTEGRYCVIKLAPKTQYEHEYIWLINFMDKLGSEFRSCSTLFLSFLLSKQILSLCNPVIFIVYSNAFKTKIQI